MTRQFSLVEKNGIGSVQYSRFDKDKQTIYSTPETDQSYVRGSPVTDRSYSHRQSTTTDRSYTHNRQSVNTDQSYTHNRQDRGLSMLSRASYTRASPPQSRQLPQDDIESVTSDSPERYLNNDEDEEKQEDIEVSETLDGFNSSEDQRSLMKNSISLSFAPTHQSRQRESVSLNDSHTSTDDAMASQTEPSFEITIQTQEKQTPSPKDDLNDSPHSNHTLSDILENLDDSLNQQEDLESSELLDRLSKVEDWLKHHPVTE